MSVEEINVKEVYNIISNHFDATRYNVWIDVKHFIDSIPENSYILDAGCGNGKNIYRKDCVYLASDFCINFLNISKKHTDHLVQLNIKSLPFKTNTFDYTMSIAVIHHIYNKQDRINTIKELIRVTKPNGKIFISVWCEHGNYCSGHNMIKWNLQNKYNKNIVNNKNIYERYYYLYKKDELKNDILTNIPYVKLENCTYNYNNIFITLLK